MDFFFLGLIAGAFVGYLWRKWVVHCRNLHRQKRG